MLDSSNEITNSSVLFISLLELAMGCILALSIWVRIIYVTMFPFYPMALGYQMQ